MLFTDCLASYLEVRTTLRTVAKMISHAICGIKLNIEVTAFTSRLVIACYGRLTGAGSNREINVVR